MPNVQCLNFICCTLFYEACILFRVLQAFVQKVKEVTDSGVLRRLIHFALVSQELTSSAGPDVLEAMNEFVKRVLGAPEGADISK